MLAESSALVGMMASEPDGQALSERLQSARDRFTSPIAVFESVLAMGRIRRAPIEQMTLMTLEFLERAGIRSVGLAADSYLLALRAHAQYGKGTGHPAQLNMGDCFSYAMAKGAGVPLLYKGNDFARTDLA